MRVAQPPLEFVEHPNPFSKEAYIEMRVLDLLLDATDWPDEESQAAFSGAVRMAVRVALEAVRVPILTENARLRAEVETKEREIVRLWNVVCDNPACTGAVIRREDGKRYCTEGHPARWVNVDLLYRLEAEIARLREKSP